MRYEADIRNAIHKSLSDLQTEVGKRNSYIRERDDYIYGELLMQNMDYIDGFDRTEYNWLERAVQIHSAQLMGRGFQLYSTYDKIDISQDEEEGADPEQAQINLIENKTRKANADARRRAINAIIRDNGGMALYDQAAEIASAYGYAVFKSWFDKRRKTWRIVLLENPQNYWAGWSDSNFRERDFDAYVTQISESSAYKNYGSKLESNEVFQKSPMGLPLDYAKETALSTAEAGDQDMITKVEYTGIIPEFKGDGDKLVKCKRGEETAVNILMVGGKIVQLITKENLLPRYYIAPNKIVPRRPWGRSDISSSCIEINRTYLERMSDWVTLGNKVLWPQYKAFNMEAANIPNRKPRKIQVIPMGEDQDIRPLETPLQFGFEIRNLTEQLKEEFVRAAGVSRVLFDDPSVNTGSNQALMTTMKTTLDIVMKKQKVWTEVLREMFTDALLTSAEFIDGVKDFTDPDEDWTLYVQWPSILHREDPVYQQMLLNRFNAKTMSVDTFLEEQGVVDTGEELDRIRDNMQDKTTAAILGNQMGALAATKISPPEGPPEPKVNVNLRGDLTPYQEANLATQQGFNDGPFPPTAGPQGNQGLIAQENADNAGFIQGNPFQGGTPIQRGPGGDPVANPTNEANANPAIATPAQNQPGTQPVSQPGTGQPPVSPQGAINQANQNAGQ